MNFHIKSKSKGSKVKIYKKRPKYPLFKNDLPDKNHLKSNFENLMVPLLLNL